MKSIDEQMLEIEKERLDREREANIASKKHFKWNLYASTIFVLILSSVMLVMQIAAEQRAANRIIAAEQRAANRIIVEEQKSAVIWSFMEFDSDDLESKIKHAKKLLDFEYYPEVEKIITEILSESEKSLELTSTIERDKQQIEKIEKSDIAKRARLENKIRLSKTQLKKAKKNANKIINSYRIFKTNSYQQNSPSIRKKSQ